MIVGTTNHLNRTIWKSLIKVFKPFQIKDYNKLNNNNNNNNNNNKNVRKKRKIMNQLKMMITE